MITCNLCGRQLDNLTEMINHLAEDHPDQYEPIETWPDGGPVIIDTTLTPEDFGVEP